VDAITLDGLLAELRPSLVGAFLERPRLVGPHAVAFEVSRERERRLRIDAGRSTAGLLLAPRRELGEAENVPPRSRHALLLFRKHVSGVRVAGVERVAGERWVRLDLGARAVVLRLSGPAPALTLVVDGVALATLGEGPAAWPVPEGRPEVEWDRIEPAVLVAAASSPGRPAHRSVAAACPGLGPDLARLLAVAPDGFAALRERLAAPRPTLMAPGALEDLADRDLARPGALFLVPLPIERPGSRALHFETFNEAAFAFLVARLRGDRFERRRRLVMDEARREVRRLQQLEAHLVQDRAGLPEAASLRRQAEALLACAAPLEPGAVEVDVDDPYEPGLTLRVRVEPGRTAAANADRLFDKARRIERAEREIDARLSKARARLEDARKREERAASAGRLDELAAPTPAKPGARGPVRGSGPRRFLTSRGLSMLVGRGARENHRLTFATARPDDLWLHARDVPGSHVILGDPEGRAGAEDVREAAEVAAFFSDARGEARVDVHVVRRKHVRPGRGGPGRVSFSNEETVRVTPRDPEGRLRGR
jgi:predicted ribosome quality control (RQC) complex YloA/Tae2 family protein